MLTVLVELKLKSLVGVLLFSLSDYILVLLSVSSLLNYLQPTDFDI